MGFTISDSLGVLFLQIKMKLVVSDHLKKMLVKLDHFPTGRVKKDKYLKPQKKQFNEVQREMAQQRNLFIS